MISDPHVFDGEYVPDRLVHRDAEASTLARAVGPALDGERPRDILLHGPHGVGKTVLAKHTLARLEDRAVEWVHIRTMGKSTAGIVRATLQELGADPSRTTPQEDLCLALREHVDDPTVVVLDEGDDLPTDALHRLADVPLVGIIPIVHDPDAFLSGIDRRIHDRLSGQELHLERYSTAELADLLEPRVREGLRTTVDRPYLERIADRASGGARKAIQTLRAAAEIAAERGADIESVDVDDAYQRALRRIRRENLQSMAFHHHVLYELVRRSGSVSSSELHDQYERVADDVFRGRNQTPIGKRSRRYKLEKLREYNLIRTEGDGRNRTYSVCDESVRSSRKIEFSVAQ